MEVIRIPLDCSHCKEMLGREEWKYDVKVCKRSVCWECKARCAWELEHQGEKEDHFTVEETYDSATCNSEEQPLLDLNRKIGLNDDVGLTGIEEVLDTYGEEYISVEELKETDTQNGPLEGS